MSSISFTPAGGLSQHDTVFDYDLLEGDLSQILGKFDQVPSEIIKKIESEATGTSITTHNSYLSLGQFFISTGLLELHPLQRKIKNAHVQKLLDQFQYQGVLRIENPGINNGSGWYNMKKLGP